ncbi:5-oxoprolinase subunit B/C family protein [Brevibacterium senegalense]|uniref:5-oxoprolinase subunit B/C family protein n=1 Tax=Brevibacterium senegalense TaxID=1033736 RepID=UPI0003030B77|nr:urea amidolyase family protein [Brevibacterium senegalense]
MTHDEDVAQRPVARAPGLRAVGDRALLLEVDGLPAAMAWHRALIREPLPGQIEAVAAARTVLLRFESDTAAEAARTSLRAPPPVQETAGTARRHTLHVVYDGEDLDATAELLGLSRDQLIERHTGTEWMAAFGGFAPGFAYCVPASGQPLWDVPRLDTPRTAVPVGAVGLAGEYSGVYPRSSPGGWRLIGHSDALLWSTDRTPPALLAPGDVLTYRAVRETAQAAAAGTHPRADDPADSHGQTPDPGSCESAPVGSAPVESESAEPASTESAPAQSASPPHASSRTEPVRTVLVVEDPGMLTLVQDRGRPGWGDVGVSPSGFADAATAEAANRVVGNDPGAALLEVVGDARLTCRADVVVAVAGSAGGDMIVPQLLRAGDTLDLTPDADLARTYLAVRGGLVQAAEVGSASADVLSGLGPGPVGAGQALAVPVRTPAGSVGHGEPDPARGARARATQDGRVVLRVVPGPRDDWFDESEQRRFLETDWAVGPQSNRVGLRLEAPEGAAPLTRARTGELASEGTVTGTVQVPAHGLPVVFGRDRPVTGGYPAIATVMAADLDLLGQVVPGDRVRFQDARC